MEEIDLLLMDRSIVWADVSDEHKSSTLTVRQFKKTSIKKIGNERTDK